MKIPTRLQPEQLKDFFYPGTVTRIVETVWGKNTCFIAEAVNGKHYWVSYQVSKGKIYKNWIQLKVAKPNKEKPGTFKLF